MPNLAKLHLKVDDMSCAHCVASVREAVLSIDPAAEVVVDLPTGTVRVDSSAEADRIREAIRSAGYPNETIAA